MPYAKDVAVGTVVRAKRTGELVHVEAVTPDASGPLGGWVHLDGHYLESGVPTRQEQATGLWVAQEWPTGSIVNYHGSLTALHERYRVAGRCNCDDCDANYFVDPGPYYRLEAPPVTLEHVRPESMTAVRVACEHCDPETATVRIPLKQPMC
jgi:hypothetical protein